MAVPQRAEPQKPAVARPAAAPGPVRVIQRKCACGGGCPKCASNDDDLKIQPRLRVGPAHDVFEQEADRVAEHITQGGKQDRISRLSSGATVSGGAVPQSVAETLSGSGMALDPGTRSYFEPLFGRELGDVRVHTGAQAAESARDVDALAYTSGRDIVFASGRYNPASQEGKKLLAHELTHVVQNGGEMHTIQRTPGGGGTTEFEETPGAVQKTGSVYKGTVHRRVFIPAKDGKSEVQTDTGDANVEFDESDCTVRLRRTYSFTEGNSVTADICGGPNPKTPAPPLPKGRLLEIQKSYLDTLNSGMNGWYSAKLEDGCHKCSGKNIPIIVVATAASRSAADTDITVVNKSGRADAATICAPDFNPGTTVHEGGHQILGTNDEYLESNAANCKTNPEWCRPERVREDYSRMNKSHSKFSLFHERHFAHVQAFLHAALPECGVKLVELKRPMIPDYRFVLTGGLARIYEKNIGFLDLGLSMGLPLNRLRTWEVVLGIHGRALLSTDYTAILGGIRVGIEHKFGSKPSGSGFLVNPYIEGGGFGLMGIERQWGAYGQAGVSASYRTQSGVNFGLEGSIGGTTVLPSKVNAALDNASGEKSHQLFTLGLWVGGNI